MAGKFTQVYQFKITLKGSKPPIWRRIQVPANYRFWDLHVAIQDAMGWQDCHLHQFFLNHPKTGWPLEIGLLEEDPDFTGIKLKISDHFTLENPQATYWYDFGDDWYHTVKLEKILPADPQKVYPTCIAGKMACPLEDSGGLWGYYEKLEILKDPKNPYYEDVVEWMGDDYDPEDFDPAEVVFDDPKSREKALESLW